MLRDYELESLLDSSLEQGNNVWVVGDIHGHFDVLLRLIENINIQDTDFLISVGDMIDRGPKSENVLEIFRDTINFHAIAGNHEIMMTDTIRMNELGKWGNTSVGGKETFDSFPGKNFNEKMIHARSWLGFIENLPLHIVLKQYRIVHAGYNPNREIYDQTIDDLVWGRQIFLSKVPVDPKRQIVVGHTRIHTLDQYGIQPPVEGPFFSDLCLEDGRSSLVMIDNGMANYTDGNDEFNLIAFNLLTQQFYVQQ